MNRARKTESKPKRWPLIALIALIVLLAGLGIFLSVGNKPQKNAPDVANVADPTQDPEWIETRFRLFPQDGYTFFKSAADIPLQTALLPLRGWDEKEIKAINVAVTLIRAVAGEEDRAFRTLTDKKKIENIFPFDQRIGVGQGKTAFMLDSIWIAQTKSIHINRRCLDASFQLTVALLYQHGLEAAAFPDEDTLKMKKEELAAVAERNQQQLVTFLKKLRSFLQEKNTDDWKRRVLEVDVIIHNAETHQRTANRIQRLDR